MMRELGETLGNTVVESVGRVVSRTQERRPLPVDLLESEDAYLAVFDAPGVEREDVQVRFEDGEIQVRIDRFRDFHEGFEMRFPGRGLSLDGSVALPDEAAVDPSRATARLTENGTLHVEIPRQEPIEVFDEADESEDVQSVDGGGTDGSEPTASESDFGEARESPPDEADRESDGT